MDEAFWQQAGRYKVQFPLSLGRCVCPVVWRTGLALNLSPAIVRDFEPVAQAGACRVVFIR